VLERGVRVLERIDQLEALEHVVAGLHGVPVPQLRVDDPAHGPDGAGLALDPDHDALVATRVVDPPEHPLSKPTAVGGDLHDATIQSPRCFGWRPSCATPSDFCSHAPPPRNRSLRTSRVSTGAAAPSPRSSRIATCRTASHLS